MNLNLLDAAVAIVISLLVIVFIITFILFIFKVQHNRRVKPKPAPKKREASERPIIPPTIIHTKDGDIVPLYHPRTILVPRAGSKVGNIGKHMKHHGKQSKTYRASVKAKRQPSDEEF